MVKLIFLFINIIMFSFVNQASAKYEKVFFDFKIEGISGDLIDFKEFKGKAILVVNTASYCGFTKQYIDLQNLWDKYKSEGLVVLGVPSNSFNQEQKSNKDVKDFCEVNFNIDFPLTQITKLRAMMRILYFYGQKIIMVNQQFQNGIFIKFLSIKMGKLWIPIHHLQIQCQIKFKIKLINIKKLKSYHHRQV